MTASPTRKPLKTIRSFVHRQKKLSKNQQYAFDYLSDTIILQPKALDFKKIFQREAAIVLEIGFGRGDSLLQQANQHPDNNYLGIEVHRPGIARLLTQIEKFKLKNIRIICADAIEVLYHCIPNHSIDTVQIFFPDPWPKTRHHKRRLIQPKFIKLLYEKLKTNGILHLATDWQHYAHAMLKTIEHAEGWRNKAGGNKFIPRPAERPLTKFEKRAHQLGHSIWDLAFSTYIPKAKKNITFA